MSEFTLDVPTPTALERQWSRHLKHGIFMGALHPMPSEGKQVTVRLRPGFGSAQVLLTGVVVQPSPAATVVQLDPLRDTTREALVELGIAEAGEEVEASPSPAESKVESTAASEPVASPEPSPPTSSPLVEAPAPGPEPPPSSVPAPQGGFSPPAQQGFSPPAQQGFSPPAQQGFSPPAQQGFSPPAQQGFSPPAQQGFSPPAQQGFSPPAQQGFSPPVAQPGAAPVAQESPTAPGPPVPESPASASPGVAATTGEPAAQLRALCAASGPVDAASESLLPAATLRGDLGSEAWREVLLQLHQAKSTGVLVLHAFREVRWGYFLSGNPAHFLGDTPHPGEFLSDSLVGDGLITREQWAQALRLQAVCGLRAGEALVATKAITQGQLNKALTQRCARITRNLMGMNFGRYSFHPLPALKSMIDWEAADLLPLLLDTQRATMARLADEALQEKASPLYTHHVLIHSKRARLLAELPFSDVERDFASRILPAGWSLGELVARKDLQERSLLRLLFTLESMGLLEFVAEEGEKGKRNRAERILYAALEDLERRNDFEALHGHWSSSAGELEAGYRKVLKECGRERFEAVLDSRLEDLIDRIEKEAAAVWERLGSAKARKEARKKVVQDDQLTMACELLFKQADMAKFKGEYPLSRACYERLIELDPGLHVGADIVRKSKAALEEPALKGVQVEIGGLDMADLKRRLSQV